MSKEHYYDVIKTPAITEKGTLISEKNQVVCNVARDATKPMIKKAVKGLFGVKVKAVNTLVRKGKQRPTRVSCFAVPWPGCREGNWSGPWRSSKSASGAWR